MNPPCLVPGCNRLAYVAAGGLCSAHKQRMHKTGEYGPARIAAKGQRLSSLQAEPEPELMPEPPSPEQRALRTTWVMELPNGSTRYAELAQVDRDLYLVQESVLHTLLRAAGWRLAAWRDNHQDEETW